MRRLIGATLILACCAAPVAADVIHLKNGGTVEGRIKRADPYQWVVFDAVRRTTFVNVADVASIELTAHPATNPAAAAARLASLRRSVAGLDDPAQVVGRYDRFIQLGADPVTLNEAKQERAVWQRRVDERQVRLGIRWLSPAERARVAADSLAVAGQARQLLKQGRFADAEPLVAIALAIDPQDVSALYLQGLLRAQQNQWADARRAFEAVTAAVPNHGPTLNNLAVLDWQQGRYADALAHYDQAMTAAPADPTVLANVSAALSMAADLPTYLRRSAVLDRVTRRADAQQRQLADRMARLGRHRFGAAWLDDDQMAQVRSAQQADRRQLDALAGEFTKGQDQVRTTDLALADVQVQMRRASAYPLVPGTWLASYDGGAEPPATLVLQLKNDADQLRQRRAAAVAHLDDLARQAGAIRRRMNGEPDGGPAQRLAGPEGTPVRVPGDPAVAR